MHILHISLDVRYLFDTELSYEDMFAAIKTKNGFKGTWEYYPQRGKYYNDGHRNCKRSFNAGDSSNNICPVCYKPLTIGVAHRVKQLANRSLQDAADWFQPFKYVLPLPEILAEIMDVSENSKTIERQYTKAISRFGNEFTILMQVPLEDIHRFHPTLSIAIERLRKDQKHCIAGYDGEHGRIYFFDDGELNRKPAQMALF